jgi:hypothetical protein
MTKTYDVASAATAGMDMPTNPMMISETLFIPYRTANTVVEYQPDRRIA